jgi:hypothetical protein
MKQNHLKPKNSIELINLSKSDQIDFRKSLVLIKTENSLIFENLKP